MDRQVVLPEPCWHTLIEFTKAKANEIAEFDDEDEIYIAVMTVVAKIEQQLKA